MPKYFSVPRTSKLHHSAAWLLFILVTAVFLTETLVMFLLPLLPEMPAATTAFLDACLLTSLIFPLFFFLVFRPLMRNLIEREQSEARLQLAASVFTHAREGILITDPNSVIVEVNDTFTRLTGYSREEALGKTPSMLQSGKQTPEFYAEMWKELNEKSHWTGEIWNRRKDGQIYAEMLTISAVRDANQVIRNYVALFTDITAAKEQLQLLESIVHYDSLTKLPNRVLLADRLHQAISQCKRHNQSVAVIFIDLDGFKNVNDTHGHKVGDDLLIAVSQRMKNVLREEDTLARIGGDEFVAVLANLEGTQDFEPVLDRLLEAAAAPLTLGNSLMNVSASMGVALYPQDNVDADMLLRHADHAMYQAKQAGKNRYCLFDAS